jgi:hypothetical protein
VPAFPSVDARILSRRSLTRYAARNESSVLVVRNRMTARATGAPAGAARGNGAPRATAWGVRGAKPPGSKLEARGHGDAEDPRVNDVGGALEER